MIDTILTLYFISLLVLFIFGSHGFIMVFHYYKHRFNKTIQPDLPNELPHVTIQLPMFNEKYVAQRLLDSVCEIEYPKNKLEIQVLDDSTDDTVSIVENIVKEKQNLGFDIIHIHRTNRKGFKAGALKEGLEKAKGEFVAIFDADFVPKNYFLMKTIPYFYSDKKTGMVQTRWEHLNETYSILTRVQALALDGHFVIEQNIRNKAGFFINFNGTGGVWRKSCIMDAGNWQADTLTEDLDLSYRAQLKGWKFKFLRDVVSPAELPAEINALKSQQFRWTKGAIETAIKLLPKVLKSDLPLRKKIHSVFHLTNNFVFPFILVAAILNTPLIFIKHYGGYESYFQFMSIFIFAFIGSFLFYLYSQKDIYEDWQRRISFFPLFMAGSMGFAVNNTRAVLEGLFGKKSEFIRTPKYSIKEKNDSWKNNNYTIKKIHWTVWVEFALAVYCFGGVVSAIYYLELASIPFQLLFFTGFAFMSYQSLRVAFFDRFNLTRTALLQREVASA
ncbi:MAG: glycosyltransferase family 2 protein [Bacteroidetes bacterium]|nr:glycosyltransferase family 2 protein [Bacteroidota bacterium]